MSSFNPAGCGVHRARLGDVLLAAVLLSACAGTNGTLAIRAERPGTHTPLSGLEVTALPVNAQAVLDTLAQRAPTPKPTFADLEAEMRAYRRGRATPASGDTRADAAWEATRDSLDALADTLRALDRASVAYRDAYERLRGLYDRFSQRAAERDRAVRETQRDDRGLALRAEQAADSLRRWEQSAYTDFSENLRAAVRRTGRDIQQRTLDSTGRARLALQPGRWWVEARLTDPEDPFEEYFWSLPVTVTPLVPAILPLTGWTAQRRWRH
jgi:hypothetical protein